MQVGVLDQVSPHRRKKVHAINPDDTTRDIFTGAIGLPPASEIPQPSSSNIA
jgi:hypothetical protein